MPLNKEAKLNIWETSLDLLFFCRFIVSTLLLSILTKTKSKNNSSSFIFFPIPVAKLSDTLLIASIRNIGYLCKAPRFTGFLFSSVGRFSLLLIKELLSCSKSDCILTEYFIRIFNWRLSEVYPECATWPPHIQHIYFEYQAYSII